MKLPAFVSHPGSPLAWLAMAILPMACLWIWIGQIPAGEGGLSFLQWRIFLEAASMLISGAAVAVLWNARGLDVPRHVEALGFLCAGGMLLVLAHAVSYLAVADRSAALSSQGVALLALAERVWMALGMLWAALLPHIDARLPRESSRRRAGASVLLLACVAVLGAIDMAGSLVEALAFVRRDAPFLLAALFSVSAALHAWRLWRAPSVDAGPLLCASVLMALGEASLMPVVMLPSTTSGAGLAMLAELLYRLLGFFAVYRAVVSTSIRLPRERLVESHELLHASQEQLRTIADNIPAMVAFVDADQIYRFVNRNYERWLGMKPEQMLGFTVAHVYGAERYERLKPHLERALSGQTFDIDHRIASLNGTVGRWLNITYMPKVDASGDVSGVYLLSSDITDRKEAESHAIFLAEHDALTTLPNRVAFQAAVRNALLRSARDHSQFAVIFVDVDRFKVINDTLGHAAGDRVLQALATRMKQVVRGQDLVARMGGDEMCVLLHDVRDAAHTSEIAERILSALKAPVELRAGVQHHVTVSAGIAIHPQDGGDEDTLLRHADIAMYRAKAAGRDGFALFGAHDSAPAEARLNLELELRTAIDDGQLVLHYQPRVDVASGRPLGVEALVRWQHPVRGLLAPLHFIDIAEETGLIVPMGEWVLREAGRALKRLQASGIAGLAMSVNVSARQFKSPRLVDEVAAMLADSGCAPHQIELELTESAVMDQPEVAQATMGRLKALGVRLAMDDFGTGYSSLAALKRFPVDCVKIDRSFVDDIPTDPDDAALTRAIIAMGHSLGLYVVAEGVERREQLDFLRREGCDEYQGYYFAKPMPEEAVGRQLREFPRAALVVSN